MKIFGQISDLHIDGSQRRADRVASVIGYLNGLSTPVDAVLVTGDIADDGQPEQYQQAKTLLAAARWPVFCAPGNHDSRDPFRQILLGDHPGQAGSGPAGAGLAGAGPMNQAHQTAGVRYLMCDSSVPGQSNGHLTDETLAWLDQALGAEPGLPAVVCLHHPPAAIYSRVVDAFTSSSLGLAAVISAHDNVAGVLCGHAHSPTTTTFAGRPLIVAPGVASTLTPPWEGRQVLDEAAPPALALHVLDEDSRLTTYYRTVR
jgi:3',5'-cyclic-AMP phosphodiesterase